MFKIGTAITTHPDRLEDATLLAKQTDATIILDQHQYGPTINHQRAWTYTLTHEDTDYCLVLEDDALPVADIHHQLQATLAVAPSPVISYYLGTSKPYSLQAKIQYGVSLNTPWIMATRMLHAVAICIRADLVPSMLAYTQGTRLPIDRAIGNWANTNGMLVAYTNPSLFDHADTPSVITTGRAPRTQPRVAWAHGSRHTWTSKATLI